MQKSSNLASHLVVLGLILGTLLLKLVPAVFAGFLVFTLTHLLARTLAVPVASRSYSRAKAAGLALVIFSITCLMLGLGFAGAHFVRGQHGLAGLLSSLAYVLDNIRAGIPTGIQPYIPGSADDLKTALVGLLKDNSERVSTFGAESVKVVAHLLVGLVIGALVTWSTFKEPKSYQPLSAALLQRLNGLRIAFERVVFAQVKISALNTAATALYLLVVLPNFGMHLPLSKTLVMVTFIAGLIPVLGNLISNSMIVVLSLGLSFELGAISLGYLIAIHKLEYFLNARIIGHTINAKAWELLLAMLAMESIFGFTGVIVAPILYAYLKAELSRAGLVGVIPEEPKLTREAPAPINHEIEATPAAIEAETATVLTEVAPEPVPDCHAEALSSFTAVEANLPEDKAGVPSSDPIEPEQDLHLPQVELPVIEPPLAEAPPVPETARRVNPWARKQK